MTGSPVHTRLARLAAACSIVVAGALAFGGAADARAHRLPKDFRWGRCLLVVDGKTRISGKCAYTIKKGGEFFIEGPRQIYDGIDYPTANFGAEQRSRDYWAHVYRDDDGQWAGYGNSDIRATHGNGPTWKPLQRQGACFVNAQARVCLWRS
jgi:hypothetical protein